MSSTDIDEELMTGNQSDNEEGIKSPTSPKSPRPDEPNNREKKLIKRKKKKNTDVNSDNKGIRSIVRSVSNEGRKELKTQTKAKGREDHNHRSPSPTHRTNAKGFKKGKGQKERKKKHEPQGELSVRKALKDDELDWGAEEVEEEVEEEGKQDLEEDPRSPRRVKSDSYDKTEDSHGGQRAHTVPSSSRSNKEETGRRTPRDTKPRDSSPRNRASIDSRNKQKEFFKEELKRLKASLKKESEKHVAPPIKDHFPYVYNTLEPYYDVESARFLIEVPEPPRTGYVSRQTAIGLCDPWEYHRMDNDYKLPPVDTKQSLSTDKTPRQNRRHGRSNSRISGQKERPPREGSTRLPKFPAVRIATDDISNKPLYYDQVPKLRNKLREKYSSCASDKVKEDYRRTKQDFFRMELDRMEAYHPSNRPNMRSAYFAYLQNTPGSRQAVYECVGSIEKGNQGNQEQATH